MDQCGGCAQCVPVRSRAYWGGGIAAQYRVLNEVGGPRVVAGTYLLIFEIAHRDGYMIPSLVRKINIDPLLHLDVPPFEKCLENASSLAHMVDT
jgi:hypothetical protein